jgi:hypothetical protein
MATRKTKDQVKIEDRLRLEYVPVATATEWERNAKKHDVGALWKSIMQHGFKDPPKYEPSLNGGTGGIVEGNGRSHILREMQTAGEAPPRGIVADADGVWLMPMLFGVDAASERAAEAYGVDHNNLVLSGGDFNDLDISKLYDVTAYGALLADMANHEELPVSVGEADVDALIERLSKGADSSGGGDGGGGSDASGYKEQYGVIVICQGESDQAEIYNRLRDEGYECKVVTT